MAVGFGSRCVVAIWNRRYILHGRDPDRSGQAAHATCLRVAVAPPVPSHLRCIIDRERQVMQTVKDLTIDELKAVIGEVVEEKLRELLADPDAGLALRPEVQERLLRDLQEPQLEGENIPAAELARRRGLEW